MPELPDLKVYSVNIEKLIKDKKVSDVKIYNSAQIDVDINAIVSGIKNSAVSQVYAQGKELFIRFTSGNLIGIHLMLNGKCFYEQSAEAVTTANKIMGIFFEDDTCLLITDFQNFCKIRYNPQASPVPDVLSSEFTMDYFLKKTEQFKRKKIKAFLLDQKILKGIGNAYADEILWKAKISPKSNTGKIPRANQEMLYMSIKSVMLWAIAQIKSINPDMINGEERKFMRVHNPRLKFTKDREKIHTEIISSKKTYYTDSQIHYY